MTRILILEDDPSRAARFVEELPLDSGYDVTICTTAKAALEALRLHSFDAIFLDHDLGGEVFVDSAREDTGAEVARWMVTSGLDAHTFVAVHSMNPQGAANITNILVEDGGFYVFLVPFAIMDWNGVRKAFNEVFAVS